MIEQTRTAYPPCTGTIDQIFFRRKPVPSAPARYGHRYNRFDDKSNRALCAGKSFHALAHGHHNRSQTHHAHLNTRTNQPIIGAWFYPHTRSDNPSADRRTGQKPVHASRRTKTYSP